MKTAIAAAFTAATALGATAFAADETRSTGSAQWTETSSVTDQGARTRAGTRNAFEQTGRVSTPDRSPDTRVRGATSDMEPTSDVNEWFGRTHARPAGR